MDFLMQASTSAAAVSKAKPTRAVGITPWVEKYRPKKVDEVVYQDEVVSVLKKCLTGSDVPNLLFYGPPGTGKTSTILALCREMFADIYKHRVLELNASDERGIAVIRSKVKNFSQQTAMGRREDGKKCPALKIIILDEADSLTKDAQSALRRTMEKESRSTRFCLICNYVSRIIEPISSRCTKFRFRPLTSELIIGKLSDIAKLENVEFEDARVLEEVISVSEGDLRKAITLLHTLSRLKAPLKNAAANDPSLKATIGFSDVREVSGYIPNEWIERFHEMAKKGNVESAYKYIQELIHEGYSGSQFLIQLHEWTLTNSECPLNNDQKATLCQKIAEADHCLLDGASEFIQLLAIAVVLIETLSKSN